MGLGGGGLVEDRRGGGPPVDQQGVAVVVAQADPADVAGLGVERRLEVEPAEDQPLVGGVELGDPPRRLEDHRVTLDQATLVTQRSASVSLARQSAGVARRSLELDVHPIDEGLLRIELSGQHLVSQERCLLGSPPAPVSRAKPASRPSYRLAAGVVRLIAITVM